MLQNINRIKSTNQRSINSIGIIFLPNNPFLIKKQPFYLKKLCGLSIIERNIRILMKNRIRDIFVLNNNLVDLNIARIVKNNRIKEIKSLDLIKDYLNQRKTSNMEIDYAIIIDGGIVIDERIILSLLNSGEDKIYIQGENMEANYNYNQLKYLAGKIKIKEILFPQANSLSSFIDFINSYFLNKSSYYTTDEIPTYKSDMRRKVPICVYIFQNYKDFKVVKKLLVKRTQKGTLDFIAWYFNRSFENVFVYLLADSKITANHITILVNFLGFFVFFLF